jgi:hypothetical protein
MKNLSTIFKLITLVFAIITAVLLSAWVLNVVSSEEAKDAIIKIAALTGIAAALSAIVQFVTRGEE